MNAGKHLGKRISIHFVAAAVVAVTAAAWSPWASAQAQPSTTQSSAERGVTVKVTPQVVAPTGEWEFAIVLDTHSAELSDDLVKSAVLLVDGNELRPVSWTGAEPGGHHREGMLKFPAPPQAPQAVELRIQRTGETAARVFRWDGAALR